MPRRRAGLTGPVPDLRTEELTPALWPALERLFGPRGACASCWCMYWRVEQGERWQALKGEEARRRFARGWFTYTARRVDHLLQRYHYWGVALASIGPIPFSTLCNSAGFYRSMPVRLFTAPVLLRIPRLLFFYVPIRLGWG